MADMDSAKLLEEIEIYIDNCKTAGVLSSGNMIKVNREELIAMLEEVRMRLPKEIAESKRIVKTKDSIIADARSMIRKSFPWQICGRTPSYQKHRKKPMN